MVAIVGIVVVSSPNSIVPGAAIGRVRLGAELSLISKELGKSATADAAMGHVWTTWIARDKNRLDVYATRGPEDLEPKVRLIRVTSSHFLLPDGLHPGSSVSSLRTLFPKAKPVENRNGVQLWDDVRSGFAFESQGKRSVAFAIHAPQKPPFPMYMSYFDEAYSNKSPG